jgi:Ca2+-binding EF-hand superfamily protein
MKKAIVITLITTLTGISAAVAQGPHKERGARGEGHFARLDTDGDGRITRDEWTAAKLDRFEAADLDGDGRVTPEEMREVGQAWKAKIAAKRQADGEGSDRATERRHHRRGHHAKMGKLIFKRLDANQDGAISRDEAQAAANRFFDKLDADGDGALTQEEMREGFRAMKAKFGKRGEGKRGEGKRGEGKRGAWNKSELYRGAQQS